MNDCLTHRTPARPSGSLSPALIVALTLAALLPACFGGGGGGGNAPGSGKSFLFLERVEWGRLVDVFDDVGNLIEQDVVIREDLQSDGVNYRLSLNPVTGAATLTILQPEGTDLFEFLFNSARTGLAAVATKGLSDPPTFTRVARNGAIRLEFSEYVDPASVNRLTIQPRTGNPPSRTSEVRYVVKQSIGADGKPKGVVILDSTISLFDQAELGIPQNSVGFPNSFDSTNPNFVIRIPTELDPVFGQTQVLTNQAGNRRLGVSASDPTELSPSLDPVVVRAMRTGNAADPFNGFMTDLARPRLITEQPVAISEVVGLGALRTITYRVTVAECQTMLPKEGDIFEVGDALLIVSEVLDDTNSSAVVVRGALLSGDIAPGDYSGDPLSGRLTSAYSRADAAIQLCWVEFSPTPDFPPATGADPYSGLTVRFDEPIDVATVRALDTMVLCSFEVDPNPGGNDPTRQFRGNNNGAPSNESVGQYIDRQIGYDKLGNGGRILFGPITVSANRREFTLTPSNGLTDSNGDEVLHLCLALRDGAQGILDLAGNPASFSEFVAGNAGQASQVQLAGAASEWPRDRYFALRLSSLDEDGDGLSEYKGQFSLLPGRMRGRPLNRFSRLADPSNQYIGQRIAFGLGLQTPLTAAGAVLMTVWRYIDLGFGLQLPQEYNLDVEGMNWSPFGGRVFDDSFDRYSLALAHCHRLPDELVNQTSGYPSHPQSGLFRGGDFNDNILGFPFHDEKVVFDVPSYPINQANAFTATSGNAYYPWPDFNTTYTWRDTAISQDYTGAQAGQGVPPGVVGAPQVYPPNRVPSIGLPLLGRFRCYPRGEFFRDNGFQVQIMSASSALPAFRVFSAGGRDSGGTWHQVVPDDPTSGGTSPTGGYGPTGDSTKNHGPELYWHQIDFVVRVSRVFTHWFALGGAPANISSVTIEPSLEVQAPGTQIQLEFRGSVDINENGCQELPGPLSDADLNFDDYGDFIGTCGAVSTPSNWTTNIQSLVSNGHEYFQLRLTFVSNIEQNLEAELDAFGFAWKVN